MIKYMNEQQLSQNEVALLNDWAGFFSFQPNYLARVLGHCDKKIKAIIKGNQAGGTSSVAYDYVRRILGRHPIAKLNMTP